jgi:hypothetical protein
MRSFRTVSNETPAAGNGLGFVPVQPGGSEMKLLRAAWPSLSMSALVGRTVLLIAKK